MLGSASTVVQEGESFRYALCSALDSILTLLASLTLEHGGGHVRGVGEVIVSRSLLCAGSTFIGRGIDPLTKRFVSSSSPGKLE